MKVAMVDPSLFTGRYDDALCDALARRGHAVRLIGRPLRGTDAITPQGYSYAPRFFRIGEALRSLVGEGSIGRLFKAADYTLDAIGGPLGALSADVVHMQWLPFARADGRLLARLRGRAALVHTVHNAQAYHGAGDAASAQGKGYAGLLPRFDALIVHGEATRAALCGQGINPAHVHIVPHPPMRLAQATAADLAAVPEPRAPRILFFGTVRPYKGLDLLVEAALRLWREGHAFELAIAGKPFMPMDPLLEPIEAAGFADRLVTELGFLTEGRLDAHLGRADIIAFPYRAIDSSGAFLSALGYGAAMMTSDAGMFGDLAGDAIARFPVGDVDAMVQTLRPLIADKALRARMGAAARDLGARLTSWDEAAAMTEQVYAIAQGRFAARCAA
jgi:glycosyltransferase involved in cell wall biosynthesis